MRTQKNSKRGFALMEVIIGIVLGGMFCFVFLQTIQQAVRINNANKSEWQASMYLRELAEIARDLENSNWDELSVTCTESSPCHPVAVSSGTASVWELVAGEETLDGKFSRTIVVERVCRNSASFPNSIVNCSEASAVPDANTKRVMAEIRWSGAGGNRTETVSLYLHKFI